MNESSIKISSKTKWEKVGSKSDEEIDFSDSPELTAEFMASAWCEPATVTIQVEPEVLA